MNSTSIEEMVQNYTDSITAGDFHIPTGRCRNCRQKPGVYKLHECRKRQFRLIAEDIVKILISFLPRWKCSLCKSTFTDYPTFVIPYKRFILYDIHRLSQKYLESEKTSYRDTTKHNHSCIGYKDPDTNYCEQFMSHSTVWRFLVYMSNIYSAVKNLINIKIFQPVFSDLPPIFYTKYRSQKRKTILMNALSAIKNIKNPIFPDFETVMT